MKKNDIFTFTSPSGVEVTAPNFNAQGYCNSDIFFKLGDKWMIAKSFGWDKANSYEEAVSIVINQQRY